MGAFNFVEGFAVQIVAKKYCVNRPKSLKGLNDSGKGEFLAITTEPKVPFRGFRGEDDNLICTHQINK